MSVDALDRETVAVLSRASQEWKSSLIDVGGTNRLLHFKKTAAVIDLETADESVYERLLTGQTVRINTLFPEAESLSQARRACAALHRRQREATEEYGVSVTHLAVGFASWSVDENEGLSDAEEEETGGRPSGRPNAPVLLRPVHVERRRGTQDSWQLTLVDDFQVNSVLLHVLNHAGIDIDEEDLLDALDDGIKACFDRLKDACTSVTSFSITGGPVLGTFSYQKQPMVRDVENLGALAASDLVSALAGDQAATLRVRATAKDSTVDESDPDYMPVDSEYLVLDADASQSYVVNAALSGRNLVVQGPPGTGKSQTIANIISAFTASGKHVLFVAQKRAAITAVLDRLEQVDLSHLLLDLFAADGSRRFVAEQLRTTLERQARAAEPEVSNLHHTLTAARDRLVQHKDALFRPDHGWGVSVWDLRVACVSIPAVAQTELRIPASTFRSWEPATLDTLASAVDELHRIGALTPKWHQTVGWLPVALPSLAEAQRLRERVLLLQDRLSVLSQELPKLAWTVGYGAPETLDQGTRLVQLHIDISELAQRAPGLIEAPDMDQMLAAISRDHRAGVSWAARREGKRRTREFLTNVPRKERIGTLVQAQQLRAAWRATTAPVTADVTTASEALAEVHALLKELAGVTQGLDLDQASLDELPRRLARLTSTDQAAVIVRANDLSQELIEAGLSRVLSLLVDQRPPGAKPSEVLRWVTIRSILEDAELRSPELAGLRGADLNEAANAFRAADVAHLEANAARVRRRAAEHFKRAIDEHVDEYAQLKTEVTRKRNFRPVRRLFEEASSVLLPAKPVWAMSPLQVSRLLPAAPCFDVVIFDEASQVKPADAIPALLRGAQVIVAGDSRQLPPTEFFSKVLEGDMKEDEHEGESALLDETPEVAAERVRARAGSFTRDAESILFALDRLLAGQSRSLQWHYRSRDERLIAVSNEHVYSRSLTTFPAVDALDSVRHVEVPPSIGVNGTFNSPEAEVNRVVDLVREHVTSYPGESIGIIAFGVKHEARIERALDQAMQADSAFERALNTQGEESWFIKAIERVQGDERDAIILTVGYGKSLDGKLRYFWGPLLRDGGERRLNVAISRAKKRMTLVTSFSRDDVPADGHSSAGFRLMYNFLRFMSSGGTELTGGPSGVHALNAFELDVKRQLEEAGLVLDSQVGVGGYRIDFAARHPERPGQHALAIEADGAAYHSGHTARERDRLRQTELERRGWRFHRIWSTDWFNDASAEVRKVLASFNDALSSEPLPTPAVEEQPTKVWSEGTLNHQLPRPDVAQYGSINDYSIKELVALTRYVRSDNVIRSAEEEQRLIMAELGFSRRGARIAAALSRAQEICDGHP